MPEFPHLNRAPITEALLNFQTNASTHWGGEDMLVKLKNLWPSHTEEQPLQQIQLQFGAKSGEQSANDIKTIPNGWIFRSLTERTAHQTRRDGYTYSRLSPYVDWKSFESAALAGWKQYADLLQPEPLNTVAIRFINQLEFSLSEFELDKFFLAPPKPPPKLDWTCHGFMQHAIYDVPHSPCNVQIIFSRIFTTTPNETIAFALDIEVMLKEPLAVSGRALNDVLPEMHLRKNEAFFGMLTDTAINRYK